MSFSIQSFAKKVRITDGVYGTELQKLGLVRDNCLEILNIKKPNAVEAIARNYVEAGSDVLMTNTLGANRFMLAPYNLADRAGELAEAGVVLSKKATAGTDVKVFGSFGPTGKIVMMGEVSEDELLTAFAETAEGLARGGADAIVLETFNELAEAEIAVNAVRQVCDLPVIVSMAFTYGPDQTVTMMGNTIVELAEMAQRNGVDVIGANCGVGPKPYIRIAKMLRQASNLPIWIKPNAGLPIVKDGETTFPMGAGEFASFVPKLMEAGTNFIGGCCGTTPEHIRAIRKTMDNN